MNRRGVSEAPVERTIRMGKKGKAKRANSVKFTRNPSRKTTIVVIAEEDDRTIWVVTAWKR